MPIAITLHVLSAIIWIGGMFFAYVCLRPVAVQLEPPQRLPLWRDTFRRFFLWVWIAIVLLPSTGFWMAFEQFGSLANWPMYVKLMMGLGMVMILLYLHVFFASYYRLKQALAAGDLQEAGRRLGQIRQIVAVNLTLGVVISIIASAGRYF